MTTDSAASEQDPLRQELARLQEANAALQQALETAQQHVKHLQFTVAHDLRAPLRHVGAFAQVIREDHGTELPAAVLSHLATIQDAANQMERIVAVLTKNQQTIKIDG